MTFGLFLYYRFFVIINLLSTCLLLAMPKLLNIRKLITTEDLMAIGTWAIIFLISLTILQNAAPEIKANQTYIIACFIGYLLCFIAATKNFKNRIPRLGQQISFALMLVLAYAIMCMLPLNFIPILSIIWAAVSLKFFKPKHATIITIIVVITWFWLYSMIWGSRDVFFSSLLYFSFHMFALMASITAYKAEKASQQARALNVELTATRELLSESSKIQERTRIARELHDLLGHHLTALNINLQVASHISSHTDTPDDLKKPIDQSYFLAKLLLSDVREAVSVIRDNNKIDISKAIGIIEAAFPNVAITYEGGAFRSENIELAHDLLRCIQEAVTNAVKHGHADKVSIIDTSTESSVNITITNNGFITQDLVPGNGIKGIQERIRSHQGQVIFDTIENGMRIAIEVPIS